MKNRGKIFDALLEMHGIGLMAGAAGTASTPVDLGGGATRRDSAIYTEGKLILDIAACSSATFYNKFQIWLQGSHDSTFTTFDTLFAVKLGSIATYATTWPNQFVSATSPALYSSRATWPGPAALPLRLTLPFCNDFAGTVYRWLRIYTAIAATVATGINYYAFLTKDN